jgi:hypothetical protein
MSISYKVKRLQAVHECIPRLLTDLHDLSKRGFEFERIRLVFDKDKENNLGSMYEIYSKHLDEWSKMSKEGVLPYTSTGFKLPREVLQRLERPKLVDSKEEAGIWLADVIANTIFKCVSRGEKHLCDMFRSICLERNERDAWQGRRALAVAVIPREVRLRVAENLGEECVLGLGRMGWPRRSHEYLSVIVFKFYEL